MNKNLLAMTALAAMLFAGCTSSDDLTTRETITKANEAATPINFGTYMGKTGTRAGATGDISNTNFGTNTYEFGVFAYNTGTNTLIDGTAFTTYTPNFMYNQKVSKSGENWTYAPVKFWPNGIDAANGVGGPSNSAKASDIQYISFFAYAPYVAKSAVLTGAGITAINGSSAAIGTETEGSGNTKAGDPTISYSLATSSSAEQVDLLWGLAGQASYQETDNTSGNVTNYNINLTKQKNNEKINFLFKHALTKVGGTDGLKIVADIDANGSSGNGTGTKPAETLITVQSITIKNVADKVVKDGVFDLATGTWAASLPSSGTDGDYLDLSFDNTNLADAIAEPAASAAPSWTGSAWSIAGVTPTASDVYKSTATTAPFYLIPSSTVDQQLTVSITYVVRTYDQNLAVPTSESAKCSKVTQTITNVVTLPKTLLLPNKKITLVLHLGLTSVKFAATVDNWDTTTGTVTKEVWLPSNVIGS